MQRVSSEARAAELHSTDLQAELRHHQEVSEEKDSELRRLQKVCLIQWDMEMIGLPLPGSLCRIMLTAKFCNLVQQDDACLPSQRSDCALSTHQAL